MPDDDGIIYDHYETSEAFFCTMTSAIPGALFLRLGISLSKCEAFFPTPSSLGLRFLLRCVFSLCLLSPMALVLFRGQFPL